jgi:hypothetical protein
VGGVGGGCLGGETGWKSKCRHGRAAEALGGADETGVRNEAVRDGDQVRKIVITRGCTEVCKADAVLEEVRGGALDVGTKSPLGLGAVSLVHHQFVRKA